MGKDCEHIRVTNKDNYCPNCGIEMTFLLRVSSALEKVKSESKKIISLRDELKSRYRYTKELDSLISKTKKDIRNGEDQAEVLLDYFSIIWNNEMPGEPHTKIQW